jgi:hypothetical protein
LGITVPVPFTTTSLVTILRFSRRTLDSGQRTADGSLPTILELGVLGTSTSRDLPASDLLTLYFHTHCHLPLPLPFPLPPPVAIEASFSSSFSISISQRERLELRAPVRPTLTNGSEDMIHHSQANH